MLDGKKVGEINLDNGSSVEFFNFGEETTSSLSKKLKDALDKIEELTVDLRDLESRVDLLERDAV